MRKMFSIAACAIALTYAGLSLAATDSTGLSSATSQFDARLQQLVRFVEGSLSTALKAPVVFEASSSSSSSSRSRTAATAQADDQTSYAMLLAGLMVMGVIIKRRYGKGD